MKINPVTVFAPFLWTAVLIAPVANADQTDGRLDELFTVLQSSDNLVELSETEASIWEIWFESHRQEIDKLMEQGGDAMESGNLPAAEDIFTRVIGIAPKFSEVWNRRATVRFYRSDYAGSLDDIERTLALEPRHFGAVWGLGMILGSRREFGRAIQAFEQLLRIKPASQEARRRIRIAEKRIGEKCCLVFTPIVVSVAVSRHTEYRFKPRTVLFDSVR